MGEDHTLQYEAPSYGAHVLQRKLTGYLWSRQKGRTGRLGLDYVDHAGQLS